MYFQEPVRTFVSQLQYNVVQSLKKIDRLVGNLFVDATTERHRGSLRASASRKRGKRLIISLPGTLALFSSSSPTATIPARAAIARFRGKPVKVNAGCVTVIRRRLALVLFFFLFFFRVSRPLAAAPGPCVACSRRIAK